MSPTHRVLHRSPQNLIAAPTLLDDGVLLVGRDRTVRRIDDDGTPRWTAALARGSSASAACTADRAFVGDESGTVHALSLADGAPTWTADLGHPIAGTALVLGPTLVLGSGATRFGARGGGLTALDAATGTPRWHLPIELGCRTRPVPLADGVVLGAHDGHVRHLAPDGAVRWQTEVGSPVLGAAALLDDRVLVPLTDGTVIGLDAHTGAECWRLHTGGPLHRAELASDGTLAFVGSSAGALLALDRDGSLAWEHRPETDREPSVWGSPACTPDHVVAATERAGRTTLVALDPATGTPAWELALDGRTPSAVVHRAGRLALTCAHDPPTAHLVGSGPPH